MCFALKLKNCYNIYFSKPTEVMVSKDLFSPTNVEQEIYCNDVTLLEMYVYCKVLCNFLTICISPCH